jgi:hypothetical protein
MADDSDRRAAIEREIRTIYHQLTWTYESLADAQRELKEDRLSECAKAALVVRKYLMSMDRHAKRVMELGMESGMDELKTDEP